MPLRNRKFTGPGISTATPGKSRIDRNVPTGPISGFPPHKTKKKFKGSRKHRAGVKKLKKVTKQTSKAKLRGKVGGGGSVKSFINRSISARRSKLFR